jgi:GNAT superfamily N-acetyltransferase
MSAAHSSRLALTPIRCTVDVVPEIQTLEAICYPLESGLRESTEAFAAKITASPDTCFMFQGPSGVHAYLISVPCSLHALPALDAPSYDVPAQCDALYLHDLCVHPGQRGKKLGERMTEAAFRRAAELGLKTVLLIAVQGSGPYWAKLGFANVADVPEPIREKVAGYGANAVLMSKSI